jgi:DNA-binding transcriptional MocR family regulator
METDAWRALPSSAQALYPWLKLEWHGPKANNNGRISLSVRQAAQKLGVNPKTVTRAFHALQTKGFIVQTKAGALGLAGAGESPCYEITEIELPSSKIRGGRALYKQWVKDLGFPVLLAQSNNPNGRNGKNKTPTQ